MKCVICGGPSYPESYCETRKNYMKTHSLCFTCSFWHEIVHYSTPDRVVVAGKHYMIGPPTNAPASGRGFGGQHFKIRFSDGSIRETTNLWCQGEIPARFRDALPDNAAFVPDTPKKSV